MTSNTPHSTTGRFNHATDVLLVALGLKSEDLNIYYNIALEAYFKYEKVSMGMQYIMDHGFNIPEITICNYYLGRITIACESDDQKLFELHQLWLENTGQNSQIFSQLLED
jgi:hypothetical protein